MTAKKTKPTETVPEPSLAETIAGLNLLQRINYVRSMVGWVQKQENENLGYSAVTHDAVTNLVRDHLIEAGVLVVPNLTKSKMKPTGHKTRSGAPWYLFRGTYDVTFLNVDAKGDLLTVKVEAHALDFGDKAPGKALSYATKYALLKVLSIASGDEEEVRKEGAEGEEMLEATVSEEQQAALFAKAEEYWGDDASNRLTSMTQRVYMEKSGDYSKIVARLYDHALSTMEAQFKRENNEGS